MRTSDASWHVGELLTAAGDVLATLGPGSCWVTGTLSSWRMGRGYGWGELLEHSPDGRRQLARMPIAVPWAIARDARRRLGAVGIAFEEGAELTMHGHLEVHPHYGPLRFLVDAVASTAEPSASRQARQELLSHLDTEGLLHANATRALPDPIRRVGLVAPATGGAGRADFVGRIAATGVPFQIVEQRAAMQGPDAPNEIARALNRLAAEAVDLIVVTRGGGAGSELAAFDSEPVARAIATAPVAIIVAVGHSTDHTIADEVAHTTLATPTAAAAWLLDRHRTPAVELREPAPDHRAELAVAVATQRRLEAERRLVRMRRIALVAAVIACALLIVLVA